MDLTTTKIFSICLILLTLICNSKAQTEVTHSDYSPTHRPTDKNIAITHIDYSKTEIVIFLCYVVPGDIRKATLNKEDWTLAAHPSSLDPKTNTVMAIQNVRINNQLKKLRITDPHDIILKRGDLLTFQLHFPVFGRGTRVVTLRGGGFEGGPSVKFQDIPLKPEGNRFLGHHSNIETRLKTFYAKQDYVRNKNLLKIATYEEELRKEKIELATKEHLKEAAGPIDYTPKNLKSTTDLECNRRVILNDVLFRDNSADYVGKVQAHATLSVIGKYLAKYPDAVLVLHGHTDVLGDPVANLELSRDRVDAVKRSLRLKGIPPHRVTTLWHGGSQPLLGLERGGAKNRRVEAEIFCNAADAPTGEKR